MISLLKTLPGPLSACWALMLAAVLVSLAGYFFEIPLVGAAALALFLIGYLTTFLLGRSSPRFREEFAPFFKALLVAPWISLLPALAVFVICGIILAIDSYLNGWRSSEAVNMLQGIACLYGYCVLVATASLTGKSKEMEASPLGAGPSSSG